MRLLQLGRAVGAVYALASFFIACSTPVGNIAVVPAPDFSAAKKSASAFFVITVPSVSASGIRPHYVSRATKSISMVVSKVSGKPVLTKNADLTPKSPGCAKTGAGTRCTIAGISLAVGSYTAEITAFSGTKERGRVLSHLQSVPFTLKGGAPQKIAFTMYGVPASFKVVPSSSAVTGSLAKGFAIGPGGAWGSAQTFLASPVDADGDTIIGAGAPHLSVVSSNSAFTLFPPVGTEQSFSIIPPQNAQSASTHLTLTASFTDKSICSQPGAHCAQGVNLAYSSFASDDWITFAHDFKRTGSEPQSTGVTTTTVASLAKRWQVSLPGDIYSSPVVYNGNVIVATYAGVVYDLSAFDGSIVWKTTISSTTYENTRSSPMIDTADGLVFMGTWYAVNGSPSRPNPSHFYALHLSDGSVAWQTVLPGLIHDAPVYANGVVYEGWSGGDAACINGGVNAFDAKTGAVKWTWLTNTVYNPGGGGGVWGALAWDGAHVVFGTGNTCQGNAWDQGAVALNPDGSMAWHFQADPTYADDNDTGGGVCIINNTATFVNKNGSLYTLDGTTGHELVSAPLGSTVGGHATPTTDGSTFVVGAGFFPTSSSPTKRLPREILNGPGISRPGYISYLKALSASGKILWSIPMTDAIDAYAAINNGVVYEGMDNAVDAIALPTGTVLAQFPGQSNFNAGPVIVPSGLYFADHSGFVYAYSLPQAGAAAKRVKR